MKRLAAVAAALGLIGLGATAAPAFAASPAAPAAPWRLTQSQTGAQIAAGWTFDSGPAYGGAYCNTKGSYTVKGSDLLLSVSGVYDNCARMVSRFTAGYGKTAARIYVPRSMARDKAAWPSFWGYALPVWPGPAGEIDVYEQEGVHTACATYHCGVQPDQQATKSQCAHGITAGWHTFAVVWSWHLLRFYYDGRLSATIRNKHVNGTPVNWIVSNKSHPNRHARPTTLTVAWWRHWTRS